MHFGTGPHPKVNTLSIAADGQALIGGDQDHATALPSALADALDQVMAGNGPQKVPAAGGRHGSPDGYLEVLFLTPREDITISGRGPVWHVLAESDGNPFTRLTAGQAREAVTFLRSGRVRYINLTPHNVVVYRGEEAVLTVHPSGTVARVDDEVDSYALYRGVEYTRVLPGRTVGLPNPQNNVIHIVSRVFLMGLAAVGIRRPDLVCPYGQVRDATERVVGCRSLATMGEFPAIPGGRH